MNKSISITKQGISSVFNILDSAIAIAKIFGLEKILKRSILSLVRAYQKHISPRKGFNCAYRILYREQSCSSYFCTCIAKYDLNTAGILLQQRLSDCHLVHLVSLNSDRQRRRKGRNNDDCLVNNNCICRDIFDLEFICDGISLGC